MLFSTTFMLEDIIWYHFTANCSASRLKKITHLKKIMVMKSQKCTQCWVWTKEGHWFDSPLEWRAKSKPLLCGMFVWRHCTSSAPKWLSCYADIVYSGILYAALTPFHLRKASLGGNVFKRALIVRVSVHTTTFALYLTLNGCHWTHQWRHSRACQSSRLKGLNNYWIHFHDI